MLLGSERIKGRAKQKRNGPRAVAIIYVEDGSKRAGRMVSTGTSSMAHVSWELGQGRLECPPRLLNKVGSDEIGRAARIELRRSKLPVKILFPINVHLCVSNAGGF